jgi:UDP-N-acetyl-D-glucosamine dehydrogenase
MICKNFMKVKLRNTIKEKIVIQGMGFVGSAMSIVCANSSINRFVFGIDLKKNNIKLNKFNQGVFPYKCEDKNLLTEYQKAIKNKKIIATSSIEPYKKADIIIVDTNLDVSKQYSKFNKISYKVKINEFLNGIRTIAKYCKENVLILIETTVPPGTTENLIKPIIQTNIKKRGLDINKIYIGHSYERVMPGINYFNSIKNYYRVYSGINKKSSEKTEKFLNSIINTKLYPLTKLNNTTESEIAKVLENSYRAMNISFMIEWSRFAEKSNSNIYSIVNAIRKRETHKNIMLPGIGVGGYCLPKDSLLADWSSKKIFSKKRILNFTKKAIEENDLMPFYSLNFIKENVKNLKNKKIFFLGCSYSGNVGDTRNSPVLDLYKLLKKKENKIFVHDPYIDFWKDAKTKTIKLKQINKVQPDLLIFSTLHNKYVKNDSLIKSINKLKKKTYIFDLLGVLNEKEIKLLSKKHIIKVLGRGDL